MTDQDPDDALVPLAQLRLLYGIPVSTLRRKLIAVEKHEYPGGRAVRWGDAVSRLGNP